MAISLGPWNGLFLWGNLVLCKGVLAAIVKFVELWFSNFFSAVRAVATVAEIRVYFERKRRRGGRDSIFVREEFARVILTVFLRLSER